MTKPEYEVLEIRPATVVEASDFTFTESEWAVFIDGVSQTAFEVNAKTGERRERDYDEALAEMFGT